MARSQFNLTTEVKGTLPVANGGTGSATATGSGNTVLATNPTLTNPVASGNAFILQPTPTALIATATLTIAQMLTGIITVTSAVAVTLTMPTGTLADAGVLAGSGATTNSFDWFVINLGSVAGAVTMAAGTGDTIVGSATIAIGTTAQFRTVKTAANTFVTYRLG